jgi:hypothetical protein
MLRCHRNGSKPGMLLRDTRRDCCKRVRKRCIAMQPACKKGGNMCAHANERARRGGTKKIFSDRSRQRPVETVGRGRESTVPPDKGPMTRIDAASESTYREVKTDSALRNRLASRSILFADGNFLRGHPLSRDAACCSFAKKLLLFYFQLPTNIHEILHILLFLEKGQDQQVKAVEPGKGGEDKKIKTTS